MIDASKVFFDRVQSILNDLGRAFKIPLFWVKKAPSWPYFESLDL